MIAVGGTGGHLFPAQALAEELTELGYEIRFIGGGLSGNPYFQPNGMSSDDISCAPISAGNPLKLLGSGVKIASGVLQSYLAMRRSRPHLVVGFGSYHTFPALLGAKALGVPIILHEANSVPGRVNRLLSPHVLKTAIHFSSAKKHLKGDVCLAGMPLRKPFIQNHITKEEALNYFSLEKDWPTLLVFGGSQGALEINKIVKDAVLTYVCKQMHKLQILHFTGEGKLSEEIAAAYEKAGIFHVVKPFEERIEYAWKAADLAITRSGACSLAEQTEFAVPGILIPYPYATDNHQEKNADAFIELTQGAIKLTQKDLTPAKLGLILCGFFRDPEKLQAMRQNIAAYRDSVKHQILSRLICEMLNE